MRLSTDAQGSVRITLSARRTGPFDRALWECIRRHPSRIAVAGDGSATIAGSATKPSPSQVPARAPRCTEAFVSRFGSNLQPEWNRCFGDDSRAYITGIDGRKSGEVVVLGAFQDVIRFDGASLTSAGASDLFVAKLAPDGRVRWARSFGGVGAESAIDAGIALSDDGSVIVTISDADTLDFGGGPLPGSDADVLLARLSPSGEHLWSKRLPGIGSNRVSALASEPGGGVVLAGHLGTELDLGRGAMVPTAIGGAFLARFDASGRLDWSVRLGPIAIHDVAASSWGVVAGGARRREAPTAPGGAEVDAYIVAVDPRGREIWNTACVGSGYEKATAVTLDDGGNIAMAGMLHGEVQCGPLRARSAGSFDTLVARLDGLGRVIACEAVGGAGSEVATAAGIDGRGEVIIAGHVGGSIPFGAWPPVSAGPQEVFLVGLGGP